MASSSSAGEVIVKLVNETPEDLVLLWTKDATTIKTFGTLDGNDRQLLEELLQCVHKGKGANATKQKLLALFGTGKDRKSVVIRATVLSRLIAIALGLRPQDITIDSETGQESWSPSVDFQTTLRLRLAEALQDDNTVLSYLFKDVLEADDEVMTVIFCDRRLFKKYPVPFFRGCTLAVVQEVSNLWLSQELQSYYSTVLEPLSNQVKVVDLPRKVLEENLFNATMMLCKLLQKRTVKAGARLLVAMLRAGVDSIYLKLVKRLVIPLVGLRDGKFRKCFLGDTESRAWEVRWQSGDSHQLRGRHGQSITIGPSSAQTDSNLLCWAARRGYSSLIWCISLGYTEARRMSYKKNLLEDATEALTVSLLWKVALWCATRHGQDLVVMELARPRWVKSIDFNDYSGIEQCLPPLHLVSLLGDRNLLHWLCMGEMYIESGAHKTDYLGKTPLDYAMQFQLTTRNYKEEVTNDIKDKMQFQVPIETYSIPLHYHRRSGYESDSSELQYSSYNTRSMQTPLDYSGWLPMPTTEFQSCIRQLLQMHGVSDRLKELNDMYVNQANFVLIGATLIASVAFVGWLQPPLGYTDYFQFTPSSSPAPTGTYEQYVAVEGHLSVQMFVFFNTLSFFLGIGTMLIGVEGTLFVHDNDERTLALMKVQKSIKWMLGFFITSVVCIMAAFICAGLAILPPIQRLEWSMIVSLCLGGCTCLIPLTWILFSLAKDQIVKFRDQMVKIIMPLDKKKTLEDFLKDFGGPLVDRKDVKTLQVENEKKIHEQACKEPNSKSSSPNTSSSSSSSSYGDNIHKDKIYGARLFGARFYGATLYGDKLFGDKLVVRSPSSYIQRRNSWS